MAILNLGNVNFVDGAKGACKLDEETDEFSVQFGNYIGLKDAADTHSLLT